MTRMHARLALTGTTALAALILSAGCLRAEEKPARPSTPAAPKAKEPAVTQTANPAQDNILRTSNGDITVEGYDAKKQYVGVIETALGKFAVEFWPEVAPNHVKNFIYLAKKGFYNGVVFHRVIDGFMIQGGGPAGIGSGGPGYSIKSEFNDRKHVEGVLSMARTNDPNSAGSQFFVMLGTSTHLDGKYSAFGKVIEGMDVVHKIGSAPVQGDRPASPVAMKSVTIVEKSQWLSQQGKK